MRITLHYGFKNSYIRHYNSCISLTKDNNVTNVLADFEKSSNKSLLCLE